MKRVIRAFSTVAFVLCVMLATQLVIGQDTTPLPEATETPEAYYHVVAEIPLLGAFEHALELNRGDVISVIAHDPNETVDVTLTLLAEDGSIVATNDDHETDIDGLGVTDAFLEQIEIDADDDPFRVEVDVPDGDGEQLVGFASGGLEVGLSSSEPDVGLLVTSAGSDDAVTVTIAEGENQSSESMTERGVAFHPLAEGVATITAEAPGAESTAVDSASPSSLQLCASSSPTGVTTIC